MLIIQGVILSSAVGLLIVSASDLLVVSIVSSFTLLLSLSHCEVSSGEIYLDFLSQPLLAVSVLLTAIAVLSGSSESKAFILVFSLIVTEIFFLVNNLVAFFVFFELSLVPMFFLILGWGKNPERVGAGKYMIMYTLVASAPLLCVLLSLEEKGVELAEFSQPQTGAAPFLIFSILAFLVNTPLFLLHSWLPRAHVEAPLEGSIILAGVILKVGVYGIIRMSTIIQPNGWGIWSSTLFAISLVGSVYSILLAISSDDLNMSVAYSSVSHINLCVSSFLSFSQTGLTGCLLTIIAHGIVSPIIFLSVTLAYELSQSRSVLINNGVMSGIPQFKVFLLLIWAMNIALPPFASFLGEVKLFIGLIKLSASSAILILLFLVLGSMFSALNFGILSHSGVRFEKSANPMFPSMVLSSFASSSILLLFFVPWD